MSVHLAASTELPTQAGMFIFSVWEDTVTGREHISLHCGDLTQDNILMRIHSSCITGECFLSTKCDCGPQLHEAMRRIQQAGAGCIAYLDQEGRGIGLVNKIKAYALQAKGLDTVEANEQLGLPADARNYAPVGAMCTTLGIQSCHLLTNNPAKVQALTSLGIQVNSRIALEIPTNTDNLSYYQTKQQKMGHVFTQVVGSDAYFMNEAIQQAGLCKNTLPNPRVGAVIVKEGKIIGRGYTQAYGGNHAEIQALQDAGNAAKGAILYVTLEPCCHQGKTPPCTDAICAAGIIKVVCAQGKDPNGVVSGQGIQILQDAGIEIVSGICEQEAGEINADINFYYENKRPYIVAKYAVSLDGKIATASGDSQWISSEASRKYTRSFRTQWQAILVGKNTLRQDDPHLGSREAGYVDPLRIILDSRLETSLDAQVFRDDNVIVATTEDAPKERQQAFHDRGISCIVLPEKRVPLDLLMDALYERHITGILIEGGAEVLGSFFDAQLVDRVHIIHAPIIIGGVEAPSAIGGNGIQNITEAIRLIDIEHQEIGGDMHTSGKVVYTN